MKRIKCPSLRDASLEVRCVGQSEDRAGWRDSRGTLLPLPSTAHPLSPSDRLSLQSSDDSVQEHPEGAPRLRSIFIHLSVVDGRLDGVSRKVYTYQVA